MKHLYLLSILFILAAVLDAEGQSFIVGDDNAVMRSSTEKITRYTEIKGVVIDSLTSEPLRDVLVSILSPEMAVRHSGTDGKGRFRFTDVKAEGLKIEITCLGYKIYAAYPESSGRILDMGKIRLGPDPQHIDQITVRARMSFFTIRGDTATRRPGAPQAGRKLRTPPPEAAQYSTLSSFACHRRKADSASSRSISAEGIVLRSGASGIWS